FERPPAKVGVEAGNYHTLPKIGQLGANVHDFVAQELRLVNPHYFRARLKLLHDFRGFRDVVRGDAQPGMRDDFVGRVARVNSRLENLHALPGNLRAAKAPDQLFALAGEHRPDNHFDPTHVALDYIHAWSPCPVAARAFRESPPLTGTSLYCRTERRP